MSIHQFQQSNRGVGLSKSSALTTKDLRILEALEKNSRASIRDIAAATGLRRSTIHGRLQRLSQEGIITQFTIKVNPKMMPEQLIAYFFLSIDKPLSKTFFQHSSIQEAHSCSGE